MPKRSVYIRPADEPVWERAAALAAADGLSRFLTAAIRLHLERNDPMSTTDYSQHTPDFSQHTHTVRFTGGVITHSHPLYPGVHPHPFEPTPQSSDLSPISADALLNRAAKAVAAAGLDDAARLVEHARPETAARLRALADEVRSWE